MIRSVIVDDEELARRHLARLLAAHNEIELLAEASNGVEALELITRVSPTLLFLDIEMPGLNGFDLLAQLKHPPLVVFVTAFSEYGVQAFDANAIDYLLKPIQPTRLDKAIDKALAGLKKPRVEYEASLRQVLFKVHGGPPTKVAARRGKRIVLLSPKEILYAAVEDEIVFIHTQTDRFLTDRTISELEELLAGADFLRISRAAIVNLTYARELIPWSSGTWRLKLTNNVELEVSRERGRLLKTKIR